MKIKEAEQAIVDLEKEARQGEVLMCDASTQGESESLAALVRRSRVIKTEVESLFKQLEKLTHQQGQLEEDFARRLEELK